MSGDTQTGRRAGRKAALRAGMALVVFAGLALAALTLDEGARYVWIKAFHVIAVISWMAGLLYMPRLFLYHGDAAPGSEQSETFKVMESRLYRVIMTPAMVLSWLLGLYLAYYAFGFQGGWLHVKLLAVVGLSGVQGYYGKAMRRLAADERPYSPRFWRFFNEIPTLLMILIVIMVIVKPF